MEYNAVISDFELSFSFRKRAYNKEAVYSDKLQHYSTGRGKLLDSSSSADWLSLTPPPSSGAHLS